MKVYFEKLLNPTNIDFKQLSALTEDELTQFMKLVCNVEFLKLKMHLVYLMHYFVLNNNFIQYLIFRQIFNNGC